MGVDQFVDYFDQHQKPVVDALVRSTVDEPGLSSLELLEAKRHMLERKVGSVAPVRNSKHALRFRQQLFYVFRRKLTLDMRDKKGILTEYIMAVFKALVMGVGFIDVGGEPAQLQLGFCYMLILAIAMGGMQKMPKLLQERTVMKMETSDALYHEATYIISMAAINTFFSMGSNLCFVFVMFVFGNMPWVIFPQLLLWSLLAFVCFDSLFSMIAAIAKDQSSAQATAIPFLLLFVIYNGFTVTKAGCPPFMQWAIRISPAAYAIEAIAITSEDNTEAELQRQWSRVNQLYEFEDNRVLAFAVLGGLIVIFRTGQAVCLQKLNKIQR